MYGTTKSPLHHGLATDRFVVVCSTTPAPSGARRSTAATGPDALILSDTTPPPEVLFPGVARLPRAISIEVPTDFAQVLVASPTTAAAWHSAVRRHFQWALRNHYSVTGLHRDPLTSRSFYTLELQSAAK